MAIYSLHHGSVGKSTQACPHTAGAHIRYITRPSATGSVQGARLPTKPSEATTWINQAEDGDRKNARVIDKIMIALPRELTAEQRVTLVRDYAEEISKGRASWLAAIHDKGKDIENPHCHLVLRDRDPDSGLRVIGLSERGSTERLRHAWERRANQALRDAGHRDRIDRRTLKAQGLNRQPTIHEGPRAQAMARRGRSPRSRPRIVRSRPGARVRTRAVNYPQIDQGVSRPVHNLRVRETTAELWATLDTDRQARELEELRAIHHPPEANTSMFGRSLIRNSSIKRFLEPGLSRLQISSDHLAVFAMSRFLFSPTTFEPGTDRIRERRDYPADPNSKKIYNPTLDEVLSTKERPLTHGLNLNNTYSLSKDKAMEKDDRVARMHSMNLENDQYKMERDRGSFRNCLDRAFRNPAATEKRMDQHVERHGRQSLIDKLEAQNRPGGRLRTAAQRPGSLLSKDGYTDGASSRRDNAIRARQELPGLADRHYLNRERLKDSQRSCDDALAQRRGTNLSLTGSQPNYSPATQGGLQPQPSAGQQSSPWHNQQQPHHQRPVMPGQQPSVSQWHQRTQQPQLAQQPGQQPMQTMRGPAPIGGPAQPALNAWHARQTTPGADPSPSPTTELNPAKDKGRGPGL